MEKYPEPVHSQTADVASPPSLSMDEDHVPITAEEERALLRKIDMRLVPSVWIMYLLSYLDRSNIGNAYTVSRRALQR